MKEKGLTTEEVEKLKEKFGKNELITEKKESFFLKIIHILLEPMFVLLIIAATIYFILGEPKDGIVMLIFVVGIIILDITQEWKTDRTLNALKDLSEPRIMVLRNNKKEEIASSELVPGDIIYIHEGIKIPADGFIIKCSGLCVDESSLTGESQGVFKTSIKDESTDYWKKDYCYQGTLVVQGTGIVKVDKIGINTEYGKIGLNISNLDNKKTPLQKQTDKLVKLCAIFAFGLFILVGLLTFLNIPDHSFKDRLIESVLSGVTLAMAMIPEEFPVILTVFLSMGAWRIAKKKSLVKKIPVTETLGAISVLCIDKTGTITKNQMEVVEVELFTGIDRKEMSLAMCLSSEEDTFDPMEKALFKYTKKFNLNKSEIFNGEKLKEYPFSNENKMVANAWKKDNKIILSAKGAPESIMKICKLSKEEKEEIFEKIHKMQDQGYRVIAVASEIYNEERELKEKLTETSLNYMGIIGFIDPPRDNIEKYIEICKKAGIRVVMITGDNGVTSSRIAKKIGMNNIDKVITGEELDKMSDEELKKKSKIISIFSRVRPEHKMRIVNAFQENGEIVAMTGDGVNDASALKKAEVGIAMGNRGSEVSREAADLILMDDNFKTIVDTIEDGRRIYNNIKKAFGYIFIIHIPIALSSLLAPLLKISPSNLMILPIHIVLLELIIDPTCSIVLERQPAESDIMLKKPRKVDENIVDKNLLIKSIIQGLMIFFASFGIYYYLQEKDITLARTMSLLILIFANMFLVYVNSSENDYAIMSIKKYLKDKVMIIINTLMIIGILIVIYTPLNDFLKLKSLSIRQMLIVILISFVSVFWYELVKLYNNKFKKIN